MSKKLLGFFSVFSLIFLLLTPFNYANAESLEKIDDAVELEVPESLLNGDDPFSITQDLDAESSEISPFVLAPGNKFSVTLTPRITNGLEANWIYTTNSPVLRVNLSMTLQYKKEWYDLTWDTIYTQGFNYAGGQGLREGNQKTWYPSKAGRYRACASGTFTRVSGGVAVYGCSGAITYDGNKIIIASEKQN
ncbi:MULTISPECIES: hypothetical protein [Bacillaceae]|uniref:hypothetical protein n=1 Tax=Bacillaceae TaxID=186817 RepID=UPI000E2F1C8F|nr:hypothetical protein [Bacillus sp. HNG]RFB09327.1 hypothetical protein DZB84_24430 [Bacillus sp. HNG]